MANGELGEVRQAIVIGLGDVGGEVLACLEQRLVERHGGIPTIRLLAFDVGPGPKDRYDGRGEIRRLDLTFNLDQLLEKRQPSVSRWLPADIATLSEQRDSLTETRLWGRLALFRHADRVHIVVREATNAVLSVATRSDLQPHGLRVKDESSLDVYIISALDEPFASGAVLDLAYLVAHTVDPEGSLRVIDKISGVLFLPSFRLREDLDDLSSEQLIAERETELVRQADAYAAAKELDFYMDKRSYQAAYSAGLTFSSTARPFTHSCYLVDARNEQNKGMPNLEQMMELVAEWLYQMLASPLKDGFQMAGVPYADLRSYGKVAAYSGLGLASYFLPINEVIDVCASRLALDMIDGHFLRQAPPDESPLPMDSGAQPVAVQDRLRDDHDWDTKLDPYMNVPTQHFANIAPQDLPRLEGQIRRTFGFRLEKMLPRLRKGMGLNLARLLKDLQGVLAENVTHTINAAPTGGVSQARRYLHQVNEELAKIEAHARHEGQARVQEKQTAERRIRDDRAGHVAAVNTFGSPWARVALVLSAAAILVWLYYAMITLLDRLDRLEATVRLPGLEFGQWPLVAAMVILVGTLLSVGLAVFISYDWWRRTHHGYIEAHRLHLAAARDIELKGVEVGYYQRAQDVVKQQLVEVAGFETLLRDVRDAVQKDLVKPRPLYGAPRFAVEESVVDEGDVEQFYAEVVGESLEDEILGLFADYSPFYSWKDSSEAEIMADLQSFSRGKFDVLRRTESAETLLIRHAVEEMSTSDSQPRHRIAAADPGVPQDSRATRRRVEELRDNSMPFLRYNRLDLEHGVEPSLVLQVGFEAARNADSPIYQILEEKSIPKLYTGDRHRIVSMSTRHGLPLAAIEVLRTWQRPYDSLRGAATRQLHTRRSHLALPDIFPLGEGVLQPQMAVAMGIAYDELQLREEDGHLTFEYTDELDELVVVDLGQDKIEACIFLQDNERVLRRLSDRIEKGTEKRVEQEVEQGTRRGNRGLIRDLRLYRRHKREDRELEEWEEVMIDEYIFRLER
jgi:hypothetical protein